MICLEEEFEDTKRG